MMPAHTPPHKPPRPAEATPRQRMAMCELAAKDVEGVQACALEVNRGGASYTVDTLEEIHDANPDARLTLIVGADMALTLTSWRRPQRLLELADLAVAERGGIGSAQVMRALEPLKPSAERVRFLHMRPIEISSSQVRERIAAGSPPDGALPEAVAAYVGAHRLYGAGAR